MKETIREYKKHITDLLNNKIYVFFIILVAVLSYGFTITNFSIGIDDLCFDRYVTGPYILAAGRWGTTLLYTALQIFQFTPFWLELVVTILTVLMGIVFTAFIKKECSDKLNNTHYIIATAMLISYPILHQSFIYQSTNLSVILSNLALMIIPILIYENFSKDNKFSYYALYVIVLPLFMSMYESCCQTYMVMMFIIAFIQLYKNKVDKQTTKNVMKYICTAVLIMIFAVCINYIISSIIKMILNKKGLLVPDYSSKAVPWLYFKQINIPKFLGNNIFLKIYNDFKDLFHIKSFIVLSIVSLIIVIIKAIKEKKFLLILLMLAIILSNLAINLLQIRILYRIDTSWCLSIAFFAVFILMNIKDKQINNILNVLLAIVIVFHTKTMNQMFYNDYIRYQKEANYAYNIATLIINKCEDTTKPIIYKYDVKKGVHQNRVNQDNGWSLIDWSSWAFNEYGSELTKFINSLGYDFTIATKEQSREAIRSLSESNLDSIEKQGVYETEKYIIVNIDCNI